MSFPRSISGLWRKFPLWKLSMLALAAGSAAALMLVAGEVRTASPPPALVTEWDLRAEEASGRGVLGNRLPASWRPFADDSPWNTPVPADAKKHPDSDLIIAFAARDAARLRLARRYTIPMWTVNSDHVPLVKVRSDRIFDTWDQDRDGWSDVGAPLTPAMWWEPTQDGHITVVDPFKNLAWDLSRYQHDGETPRSTTFTIWDLTGPGMAPPEGRRWAVRGGRGSGFPLIAGLIRPEELAAGEIRHALVFMFRSNRRAPDGRRIFLPPASRSDGRHVGNQFPIEGMRFRLDPSLTEQDFDRWGLTREGKIIARALQRYGMFLGDNGGSMSIQLQLLSPSPEEHYRQWEALFPGLHASVSKIPTDRMHVVYTGEPIIK